MERSKKGGAKVYAFNTFFYPKLMNGGHAVLKRWTRRVDLFAHDFILVFLFYRFCFYLVFFSFLFCLRKDGRGTGWCPISFYEEGLLVDSFGSFGFT